MPGVYSTRFILFGGAAGVSSYVVPAGKTAVIKGLTAYNADSKANTSRLDLDGIPIWQATIPVASGVFQSGLFIVLGPGETLGCFNSAPQMVNTVCGYLLDQRQTGP